ncbi:hypothetical protein SAMN05421641_102199 [Paracoccus thiocyanatus]|uniref:Uncharacterized protein n=2 Tax=Paracoccus thiocyanatus TaxID=34006 RepID=A0A1N6P1D9_9RHOB|nr:hypothetical protein SAMN05421641_102199 [Paracoccus thiocyanatus]
MVQATKLPVDTSVNAMQLAEEMFGRGVTLVSASYTGNSASKGIYSNGEAVSPGVVPADGGIILSTGRADAFTNDSGEANHAGGTGSNMSGAGHARLDDIAGVGTRDAAIIQATFIPEGSTLTMQLVFSSEEYPEYANAGFNDAVGIFVNGVRAELTIGSGDISIDNITQGGTNHDGDPITPSNENLYVDNTGDQYNTEMDGFTVTLTLKAPVTPGVENTIWIGIADAGDSAYDSNLLIAADSVQTEVIAYDDNDEMERNSSLTLDVLGNDTAARAQRWSSPRSTARMSWPATA